MPADRGGYAQLERWATGLGRITAFGIEGTASYGAGVTSYVRCQGRAVIEVNRPDRRERRINGKSDLLDAENAAPERAGSDPAVNGSAWSAPCPS